MITNGSYSSTNTGNYQYGNYMKGNFPYVDNNFSCPVYIKRKEMRDEYFDLTNDCSFCAHPTCPLRAPIICSAKINFSPLD